MTRAQAMRAARHRSGLSLRELAEKAKVSFITIHRLETGERCGGIDTIECLADALGLSIDEYIGHEVKRHG